MINAFTTRLWEDRDKLHLTQKEVQKKTGICDNTLSQYENGIRIPHRKNLMKLIEVYGDEELMRLFTKAYGHDPQARNYREREHDNEFTRKLVMLRNQKGLTQVDVAKRTGTHITLYNSYEMGTVIVGMQAMKRFIEFYDAPELMESFQKVYNRLPRNGRRRKQDSGKKDEDEKEVKV